MLSCQPGSTRTWWWWWQLWQCTNDYADDEYCTNDYADDADCTNDYADDDANCTNDADLFEVPLHNPTDQKAPLQWSIRTPCNENINFFNET